MKITFVSVTKENYAKIINLKVKKKQEGFIETTSQCLEEASELPLWKPVGIYAENELIGFAMYGLWKNEGINGRVWLDRFLIDEKHQGKGYGKSALPLLINRIFDEYHCDEIFLSLYDNNLQAMLLYQKLGFALTGEVDVHGEKIMVIPRNRL